MTKKIIENAQIYSITLVNAKKISDHNWETNSVSASNGSLADKDILITVILDRDTEDYYLKINNSKIEYVSVDKYYEILDASEVNLAKQISSKIGISLNDSNKSIFAARAIFTDEASDIDKMEFEYTYDNDYGNINPSKFFSNKSEILNRVWIGIGMNHTSDKVKLDLSSGTLDFDREALDENRICAWSKFKV